MRKLTIAVALASTALATPAVARDHSFYAGLEGGVMWIEDVDFDYADTTGLTITPGVTVAHHSGFDVDAVAGYDFGMLRLEGEVSYKRASVNQVRLDSRLSGAGPLSNFDASGRSQFAVGNGQSAARLRQRRRAERLYRPRHRHCRRQDEPVRRYAERSHRLLRQPQRHCLAGASPACAMRSPRTSTSASSIASSTSRTCGSAAREAPIPFELKGRWRSHSIMASVLYNFWRRRRLRHLRRRPLRPAAASGDADVPGRLGDPGDRRLPGTAASASAAATGARARPLSGSQGKEIPVRASRPGRFSFVLS